MKYIYKIVINIGLNEDIVLTVGLNIEILKHATRGIKLRRLLSCHNILSVYLGFTCVFILHHTSVIIDGSILEGIYGRLVPIELYIVLTFFTIYKFRYF